jgi:serine/threonine protein kinase
MSETIGLSDKAFSNHMVRGQKVGSYLIERPIGQGGMGMVYEATDSRLHRQVALKVIQTGRSEQEIKRFCFEAESAARLQHSNIVPIHDVGSENGLNYYTMDFIQGVTLDDWLRRREKTFRDRIKVLEKISRAIDYAHRNGVIHRDIKPGNIMVDEQGEPHIMDFGLARSIEDTSVMTIAGAVLGTPSYMSPEQAEGRVEAITTQADVWGLGAVLYEALTGRPPFSGESVYQTLAFVSSKDPVPPRNIDRSIPRDLQTICLKCLEKNPQQRYESASDVAADLRAWLEGEPIKAHPPTTVTRISKKILRNKAVSIVTLISIIVLLSITSWYISSLREKKIIAEENLSNFLKEQQARGALQNQIESEAHREWKLIFEDNFNDAHVESRWEILGDWKIQNGELEVNGGSPKIVCLRKPVTGDVRIEFDCHTDDEQPSEVSCFLNGKRSKDWKDLKAYFFQYGGNGNTQVFLEKGAKRLWGRSISPIIRGAHYHVRAERIGTKLNLRVNDDLIFEVEDAEPLSGLDCSLIGLYGWGGNTYYDNVRIYQLGTAIKADPLDLAERHLLRGDETTARDLFNDVLESATDPKRLRLAQQGLDKAKFHIDLENNFKTYEARIHQIWPKAIVEHSPQGLLVNISRCNVSDLSPLKEIPITNLSCFRNQITTLEPLRGKKLAELDFSWNKVSDLEPLTGMPLTDLRFGSNKVTKLDALKGMPLTTLVCRDNAISTLEPLKGILLNSMDCALNQISDLEPLRGMPLVRLTCDDNKISSLEPLAKMMLTSLTCSKNSIKSLQPLSQTPLISLNCSENLLEDLEGLSGLPLHHLFCSNNRIKNLLPLKDSPLEIAYCFGNPIKTLKPFEQHPPKIFYFSGSSLSEQELQIAIDSWSKNPNFRSVEYHGTVALSIRKKDISKLRDNTKSFNQHHYLLVVESLNWNEAQKLAQDFGGHLVSIDNKDEEIFLRDKILDYNIETWTFEKKVFIQGLKKEIDSPDQFRTPFVIEWDN